MAAPPRRVPPPPARYVPEAVPERRQAQPEDYWQKMDALFYRTISHAEEAFKISIYISIIVVIVGVVLLTYSMVYGWANRLDLYSTAFGSLGVISFVATFYFTPQRKIQETVGDLTQIQMLYRTYYTQVEALIDWDRENPNKPLDQLERMIKQYEDLTDKATRKVEELIGKDK